MDASSALDPPERDQNVELRPLRGSDAPQEDRAVKSVSGRQARSPRGVSTVGSGQVIGFRKSVLTILDTYLSSSPQRKKGVFILLSTLCLSLLVMVMAKRGAVGIEKKVELGVQEDVVHIDVDHHHQEGSPATTGGSVKKEESQELTSVKSEGNIDKKDSPTTGNSGGIVQKEESQETTSASNGGSVQTEASQEAASMTSTDGSVEHVEAQPNNIVTSTTEKEKQEDAREKEDVSSAKVHIIDTKGYQPTEMISPTYFLPGTENAPRGSAAGGGFDYPLTNHFQFRNPNSPTASTWGYFDFEDPREEWRGKVRPIPNFESVSHRDVKGSDFPEGSWQKDDEYMKRFLSEAKKLVNRTMEAIYAEYGVGVPDGDLSALSDELLVQREEFAPYTVIKDIADDAEYSSKGKNMWTTQGSLDGLARRLIHAIITQDTFHIALGGHSAAAGHGNGFNQSYIIQAGLVLEPVFAHLGVTLRTYNFAQGGMGTLQQALAGMDLRGKETDMVMWDSSMTERIYEYFTFFMKQALISGNRAPYLVGYGFDLREFNRIASADIGDPGSGWDGPVTLSEEQALELPWAARFLTCSRSEIEICKKHEYEGNGCWVDRDDFTPPVAQSPQPGGQASWHPGNRWHKIRGRRIALLVLRGLEYALQKWEDLTAQTGHPLADEYWHVTDYYKAIKEKATLIPGCPNELQHKIGQARRHRRGLRSINERGRRLADEAYWPWRICDLPLHGRSLWGPRYDPIQTSLVSILKPNAMGDLDPTPNNTYLWPPIYYPPEMIGPWNVPPPNDVNVEQIASARKLTGDDDIIVPGYGFDVNWGKPGHCDGSSHSWCDKHEQSSCLMGGTQDSRGSICFNGLSGWVVFQVKDVKYGFVAARIEAWHDNGANKVTQGWTEVNNGGKGNYDKSGRERRLFEQNQKQRALDQIKRMNEEVERDILEDPERRHLKGGQSCGQVGDYVFEWAIDGNIVTWDQTQFCDHYTRLAYNMDVILFMDDTSKTGDFELAMRIKNTGSREEMCISHLYWA